ncbi:hypothetical protein PHYBLDRAFT_150198 [Phycomyces blakesleeanus NRRL 1555(-)]|uniref:Uncharacterized protein n=1 Tax=Phycomyces blakesleeanus (strain ATCC 8743b / DSM 1359 / FGSC 10004 / NBRC 33097 / NRRL 1555) TaxID=763407 RepID=A0A163D476_PHYB8|nr:hypothetical protein PHYBLDRAFT_150198 [Phycomyces blakesleeanus NRRL 1555(-)]OAD68600.1 hypothetical protein PHYBLDRAFT_150198 [Phycomyces blakesleeanus NRRL 1555(-)]|eukprot:XP_018286640.1 hypothetical protein PHYBLDRAFT_150198 [Phycomyces blakesleeanus NRRL 1555(-)]
MTYISSYPKFTKVLASTRLSFQKIEYTLLLHFPSPSTIQSFITKATLFLAALLVPTFDPNSSANNSNRRLETSSGHTAPKTFSADKLKPLLLNKASGVDKNTGYDEPCEISYQRRERCNSASLRILSAEYTMIRASKLTRPRTYRYSLEQRSDPFIKGRKSRLH